jgi:hypothetical protein
MDKIQENIERILELMERKSSKKKIKKKSDEEEIEMKEEGEAAGGSGPSSGYPTVTKWETGLTRGPGNPVGNAIRQDKTNRGKANRLI